MLDRGALVSHAYAGAVAWRLFAILGPAKPDARNNERVMIQALARQQSWQPGFIYMEPMVALISQLTPLSEYGMRIARIVTGDDPDFCGSNYLKLAPDDTIAPRLQWGTPNHWARASVENFTTIHDDELAGLIKAWWASQTLAEAA